MSQAVISSYQGSDIPIYSYSEDFTSCLQVNPADRTVIHNTQLAHWLVGAFFSDLINQVPT